MGNASSKNTTQIATQTVMAAASKPDYLTHSLRENKSVSLRSA